MQRHVKKGQKVFSENDRSKELYFIEKGSIKIQKTKNGRQMELAVLTTGSIFGEMALLDGKPRSATAFANEDTDLIVITEDEFNKKIENVPKWYLAIIRVTSARLRLLNDRLNVHHRLQNVAHVAHLLVLILKKARRDARIKNGIEEDIEIDIKFVKGEIVQILGINKSVLTESLDFLEKKNLILQFANNLTVNDEEELLQYSKFLKSHQNGIQNKFMDENLRLMLIDLKGLLDKSFSKSEVVTFSRVNIEIELQKNTQIPSGREEWFLDEIGKMKIVKFIQSNGSTVPNVKSMESTGQISIDSNLLTHVLQQESFSRMGL